MTGMRLRAALVTAIYRKTLVLSNASRQKSTVGEVSLLLAKDSYALGAKQDSFRSLTI